MNLRYVLLIISFLLLSLTLSAQELNDVTKEPAKPIVEVVPQSNRSSPDDSFWFAGKVGLLLSQDGINGNLGLGTESEYSFRYQQGLVGIYFEFHKQDYSVWDPASFTNRIWGLGATYRILTIHRTKFFEGAFLMANAEVESGKSIYHIEENKNPANSTHGEESGMGLKAGAQFYVPIYYGFWGFASAELERTNFSYSKFSVFNPSDRSSGENWRLILTAGIAYSL